MTLKSKVEGQIMNLSNEFDDQISTLANNVEDQIINLTNKNSDLQNEVKNMKYQIITENFTLYKVNPRLIRNIKKLIPEGQKWTNINPTEGILTYKDKNYYVKSSSTYDNHISHHPINLFDGKLSSALFGTQWASNKQNKDLPSYIKINFDIPVKANVLLLTSKSSDAAPTDFEIFGCNEGENFVSLDKYNEVKWTENDEKQAFPFFNDKKFTTYKVVFYKSKSAGYFACAELNLGEVIE